MKMNVRTKKVSVILIGAFILAIMAVCIGVATFSRSQTLFNIEPSEVVSITLSNGDKKRTQVTITEKSKIEEIVKLINNFTYTSTEELPPMDGTGYYAIVRTSSENMSDWVGFGFWSDGIKVTDKKGEPGATIKYYGKTGYFDSLVTLADNATDPM